MLGFGAISSAAISALPDNLSNFLSISFTGSATFAAYMYDPYAAFVRSPASRRLYTVEFTVRAVG